MKKNILKIMFALLLAISLFALASCSAPATTTTDNTENAAGNTGTTEGDGNTNQSNDDGATNQDGGDGTTNQGGTTEEAAGYAVTFATDEHSSVTVYPSQDMTTGGTANATVAYSIDKTTGEQTKSGEGQVNFVVVLEEGYVIDSVTATAGTYNNIKGSADTGVENGYRITKITADLTVTITTKVAEDDGGDEEDTTEEVGFAVTFATDEHASVTVYPSQDMTTGGTANATVAYSIDKTTGKQTKSGEGQVNFVVVLEEGYVIDSVTATAGTYKNIKDKEDTGVENGYRITKITADLTVTITTKVAE